MEQGRDTLLFYLVSICVNWYPEYTNVPITIIDTNTTAIVSITNPLFLVFYFLFFL
jgi:hypothetical protein